MKLQFNSKEPVVLRVMAALAKDRLCYFAILLAIIGVFPHVATGLSEIIRAWRGLPVSEAQAAPAAGHAVP